MQNAGYTEELSYFEKPSTTSKRNWKREVKWFNPTWNDAVATNVAGKFLQLIDKHFPRNSQFHKQFNRSTVKVSYSCMPNMANIISGHNKKVTGAKDSLPEEGCNFRKGTDSCVLGGKCLTKNINYKGQVTLDKKPKNTLD